MAMPQTQCRQPSVEANADNDDLVEREVSSTPLQPTPTDEAQDSEANNFDGAQESGVSSPSINASTYHERRIARKPVPGMSKSSHRYAFHAIPQTGLDQASRSPYEESRPRKIYWLIPTMTMGLFLLGLGMAIGHHFFLQSLHNKTVSNQVWINRYSLAMAFVVKFSFAAAISTAYVQRLWYSLQHTKHGVTVQAIDALFTVQESLIKLFTADLWRSAFLAALMAIIIWLIPLAALISPTALSVGSLTRSSKLLDCVVPTLRMRDQDWQAYGMALSLSTVSYTATSYSPSMTTRRLVGSTCQGGQPLDWTSPCGSNCSYEVSFIAPSIKCSRTPDIDDPEAPWTLSQPSYSDGSSYWFSGYGSGYNYSFADEQTLYDPLYYAGLNDHTSQFWVGVSDVFSPVLSETQSVEQGLNIHVYVCDFMNSSYRVRTKYVDGQQTNELLNISHVNRVDLSSKAWNNEGPGGAGPIDSNGIRQDMSPDALDLASVYQTMISMINGSIIRDPREELVDQTTISLVPTLITQYNGSTQYGQAELAVPHLEIGPLIEELSHNISISLLSEPRLQVTNTSTTSCATSVTSTVWKYSALPLIAAYASAVGLTILCLVVGAHAMLSSGAVRDKAFSTVVRTTRTSELDVLGSSPDNGALPLAPGAEKIRLVLSSGEARAAFRLSKQSTKC
ncbi:hypothetical protein LTR99_010762 [Exophiala xenobiotica]|uniref:Uncharacterized protein n=1 Tax=Vermiconidia calcicola TaxID=1690605 RepID=A0AAV9PS07_9PEZI|nr:hypothetical protein LTR99_010762 [Exophiala xenobiotica]KAK5427648.1 hypothetical protein LTR34_009136 [Exophiala xenobiotica]KAK5527789.1 hypothetical protein LTR25_010920 [Vermiconidia calcicola]KAK5538167.1 hypothetical protein LTR23_007131 [Chaetothyriales sp. CCFEE 6169]KAK5551474.1 hypothetical protein LTR46_010488 [Exophiala xenobiotica]